MDDLIERIRSATAADATDEARAIGAHACRSLLTVLETKPGEPILDQSVPSQTALSPSTFSPAPTAQTAAHAIVSAMRGMNPDQLLDLAISRLRAALPAGAELAAAQPLKFHLVPIHR